MGLRWRFASLQVVMLAILAGDVLLGGVGSDGFELMTEAWSGTPLYKPI